MNIDHSEHRAAHVARPAADGAAAPCARHRSPIVFSASRAARTWQEARR
jgi:hypothetical protein